MTFFDHLPILLVITPLLSAPIVAILREARTARIIASVATALTAAIAWGLVEWTSKLDAPLSYHLGGWAPPIGIEYRISKATALVSAVVSSIAAVSILVGTHGARREVDEGRQHLFYAVFLLCLTGLLGMAATGDAFNVFVFLEVSSLSTYILIAMGKTRRAFTASFKYLILGTIGGTFVLLGIGFLFAATGSLNAADIAQRLTVLEDSRTAHVAFAFLAIGFSLKLAVFPLHQWLPGAYADSPSAVGAFLAGTATKIIYFQLIRVCFGLFGVVYVFERLHFGRFLLLLSLLGMFLGSLTAVYQSSLRRLLAYSSIGQVGYLTLALSFGTAEGVRAGLLHLGAHGLTKAGLFLVVAAMISDAGSDRVHRLRGYGRRHPIVALLFVIGGLGLIGVPGTAGFVSKWALLEAAFAADKAWVAIAALLSSLIAVVYVWRVVEIMYLRETSSNVELGSGDPTPNWKLAAPAAVLLVASLVFGVYSAPVDEVATAAAEQITRPPILDPNAPSMLEAVEAERAAAHAAHAHHPEHDGAHHDEHDSEESADHRSDHP